jgi:hypothetical protein
LEKYERPSSISTWRAVVCLCASYISFYKIRIFKASEKSVKLEGLGRTRGSWQGHHNPFPFYHVHDSFSSNNTYGFYVTTSNHIYHYLLPQEIYVLHALLSSIISTSLLWAAISFSLI